jgi:hypothetical protein
MSNKSAVSEKIGSHHDHDRPQSPIHKGSFDIEEGTIHHRNNIKEDLNAAAKDPPVQQLEMLEDEYPDGGLRAWLVVLGVSALLLLHSGRQVIPVYRQYVTRSRLLGM